MMQVSGWLANCAQIKVTKVSKGGECDELQLAASWPGALHGPSAEEELKTLELNSNCSHAVWIEVEESGKQKNE